MSPARAANGTESLDLRNLLQVLTAVKKGDFSVRMPIDYTGVEGKIADTLNEIIELNEKMVSEFSRLRTIVGKSGRITQRATLGAVDGGWAEGVDSVNMLVTDLVQPTSEMAAVIRAVARGDLTQKVALEIEGSPLQGEFLETANIVNTMVDQLSSFASEVTRVAREVGTEGKLGGQAQVKGVGGAWKDLTDNVNLMANNLTLQVRNIAEVSTAIATGDLSKKITVDVKGEILELKNTINTMVDQLSSFASEVTRVAREVGTEGKLGGQADVRGVAGTWKDLTDNVNLMANNLTLQVRNIADVSTAIATGDLSKKITVDVKGEILELKNTINTMVDQLNSFAFEVTRVAREVGTEGKLGGQSEVKGVAGTWKDLTDNVNLMANNLTLQVRNIAEVTTAVASGDLSKKITVDVKGEILELKNTMNTMVDQLNSFASEVTRVAREVGTEGKLGGQADVRGVGGAWNDLTDNVNLMANNLTLQVRNIAEVTTAIANGNLAKKITVDVKGEILELKNTMNTMVDQLNSFAFEVTRVAREVGTEGKLGGQADVRGVAGTWKDLTDNVNLMANNLTLQVRNIADVSTAIANGDLSKKITVDVKGEILELKGTMNTMVDQLNSFASEVTRVAREVGTEGKLGGQAEVRGVAGTWKDLTDNVNLMADNLTLQVRNIADVSTAIANGDLSKKITVDVKGEILELKNTINTMVDQLNSFASEVTRVAREVGTEGKLGGQADVRGVGGTWKDLTDNVNLMANNLTLQVRNIAEVTTAVANGNLAKKITVDVKGEILELKNTMNTMVDQLNSFASEVTRVAREVGTEGKLGGQADVPGVAGTWKDLTDNVNLMADNLTLQVRNIAEVSTAIATGDLSKKITVDVKGEILELKNTINTMVDQLNSFASEVTRVAREVGTEGKLGGQAYVRGVGGTWKDLTDNVNLMANNLTLQVRNIAEVSTAIASGDLSKKITVDVKGEILELKNTINTMVDQLNSFASEVTRVAREVGTEGKLGGQAHVRGVGGTWKDLTDNVNLMANNLTGQVRGIALVVTAVAQGDLKRNLALDAKGEIAALADTINGMIDTLATFADQVTSVAREVGIEGKLGGQAHVPGAAGIWRDLTDNVNGMAANLTTQVRAIAEVATAVTRGDLTRTVTVTVQGELADLKENVNQMIANLRETTQKNIEQDWLKTNLAKFTRMLQGQRNLETVGRMILSELAPLVNAHHGIFYIMDNPSNLLKMLSSYAFTERKNLSNRIQLGEGLVGQSALERQKILLTNVPADYIKINSGLGESTPLCVIVLPILFEEQVIAVVELASFNYFHDIHITFLDQLTDSIGIVMTTISAATRTEELLKQSQELTNELRLQQTELTETNRRLEEQTKSLQASEELAEINRRLEEQTKSLQASEELLKIQQEELQQTNEELEEKARLLEQRNMEVERKNREIDLAKSAIEEKVKELALSDKYKSEFLANMSHELRTPLNSMLILSKMLADNSENNLTSKQREFATTIHSAGTDLLELINDILDLAKIESGKTEVEIEEISVSYLTEYVERNFREVARNKQLEFKLELDNHVPSLIYTDPRRVRQVIRNLLSNAFKFTERGSVTFRTHIAKRGWSYGNDDLNNAELVIAFSVIDTGIGIPDDKQKIIFEPFQQADGTTSRKYGGTGLGLSISREIARLLNGEIGLVSHLGAGSTFTLYLPQNGRHIGDKDERTPEVKEVPIEEIPARVIPKELPLPSVDRAVKFNTLVDDRGDIQPNDMTVLIMDADLWFANQLAQIAHERNFKILYASTGEVGFSLVNEYMPSVIMMDVELPGANGWQVLDRLKHTSKTRHIPVHLLTNLDERKRGLQQGALTYHKKPVNNTELGQLFTHVQNYLERPIKNLLVVEDEELQRSDILSLIGDGDVKIVAVASGEEAINALENETFDCVVLDLRLPDMTGFELLGKIKKSNQLDDIPVIIYTGKTLTKKEENELRRMAETIIIKDVYSRERLLAETSLYLHRAEKNLPLEKRQMLEKVYHIDNILRDRKILIVDDDIRNIFVLTSILERHQVHVIYAENGKDGIKALENTPDVDLVLMDIMMPEMDGYETMRTIRKIKKFAKLPIIALTAKAMHDDRQKCIEAGASDYITKPVNTDQLLSLMRVWLYR
jgi:HAMP domain-containing protein/signal transduction histidine kinase/CheY-like chemotaxis protein